MGMYDSILIDVKCPNCGAERLRECQTKDFKCNLEVWRKGDFVSVTLRVVDEIDCITDCAVCDAYFNLDIETINGYITGEYKITSKNIKEGWL